MKVASIASPASTYLVKGPALRSGIDPNDMQNLGSGLAKFIGNFTGNNQSKKDELDRYQKIEEDKFKDYAKIEKFKIDFAKEEGEKNREFFGGIVKTGEKIVDIVI
jgi:hypothetical protein